MKLSTRGKYGIKALFELALQGRDQPVPLRVIAERQGLSCSYLEQLIGVLKRAGLVRSVRGAHGGYVLAQSPDKVTVGDVIRALEGPIGPCECATEGVSEPAQHCGRPEQCVARGVWEKIRDTVVEVLDAITLEDLCRQHGARENSTYRAEGVDGLA